MRPYFYLLYRIYFFYVDRMREEQAPLFYVTAISTVLVFVNLFAVFGLLDHYGIITLSISKYMAAVFLIVAGSINYFLFVRDKKFLDYDFEKDNRGTVLVVLYFVLTVVLFVVVANQHRKKVLGNRSVIEREIQIRLMEFI